MEQVDDRRSIGPPGCRGHAVPRLFDRFAEGVVIIKARSAPGLRLRKARQLCQSKGRSLIHRKAVESFFRAGSIVVDPMVPVARLIEPAGPVSAAPCPSGYLEGEVSRWIGQIAGQSRQ